MELIETVRKKIFLKTIFESMTYRRNYYLRKFQNAHSKDDTCLDITRVHSIFYDIK